MTTGAEYVERAKQRVITLLGEHHVMVSPEVHARISEGYYGASGRNIDPHHITTALRELHQSGEVYSDAQETRGGQVITTVQLSAPRAGTKTAVTRAAGRKRLLLARYNGWAQGTKKYPHGLIGPAGEEAVRSAIAAAGAMQPATPGFGQVANILKTKLPGPADSGGYLVPILTSGLPGPPVTVLVEVKNIRSWIYPSSEELVQLLNKLLILQLAHPDQPIVGVLACRKAHTTTFWMAQQLGFMVIQMDRQFAGNVGESEVNEVRNELFMTGLHRGEGPSARVQDRVAKTLPRIATIVATRWQQTASNSAMSGTLTDAYKHRRNDKRRLQAIDALRLASTQAGHRGGW